jgi:predicted branched-subunit amino acid permease
LGFAGVLALLGVLLSLLFDRATWLATAVAATAAMAAFALPLKLNILVAIAAAVAAGLLMEAVEQQRQRSKKIQENAAESMESAAGGALPSEQDGHT